MTSSGPEGQPAQQALPPRPPEEQARHDGMIEVAETLLNIEQAKARAQRAAKEAAKLAGCDDLARLLTTASERMEAARKELMQGAYFSAGQSRLF